MLGILATGALVQSNCILSDYMQVKYRIITIIGLITYNIHGVQVCHAVTWKNSRRRKGPRVGHSPLPPFCSHHVKESNGLSRK